MCGREVFRRVGLTYAGGLAGIGLLLSTAIVHALPIVSVDTDPITPGIQSSFTVGLGDIFSVDIFISDVEAGTPLNGFEAVNGERAVEWLLVSRKTDHPVDVVISEVDGDDIFDFTIDAKQPPVVIPSFSSPAAGLIANVKSRLGKGSISIVAGLFV